MTTRKMTGIHMSRSTSFLIAALVLFADQLTKMLVIARVEIYATIVIIPGALNIIRSTNRGIAFGILSDSSSPWIKLGLIVLASAVMIFIGGLLWKTGGVPEARRMALAMALVMGGAAGNLVDRLLRGEVTDFLDFYVGGYHWYTFNVADAAITVGAALVLLDVFAARPAPGSDAN